MQNSVGGGSLNKSGEIVQIKSQTDKKMKKEEEKTVWYNL